MKERIVWVDWMKALLIMMVVLGHTGSKASGVIYMFHIPAFFFISGYLSNYDKLNFGKWNSAKNLVYAMLIYNGIFIFVNVFTEFVNDNPIVKQNFLGKFYQLILRPAIGILFCFHDKASIQKPMCPQFWFVWTLLIIKFIYSYLSHLSNRFKLFLCLLCVFYVSMANTYGFKSLFYVDRTIIAFPFFVLGNLMRGKIRASNNKEKRLRRLCISILCLAIIQGLFIFNKLLNNNGFDMFYFRVGSSAIIYYISSLVGTLCLLKLCQQLDKVPLIKDISIGTFLILGIHLYIIYYINQLAFIQKDLTGLLSLGIILVVCVPLIKSAEKHFPLLLGK